MMRFTGHLLGDGVVEAVRLPRDHFEHVLLAHEDDEHPDSLQTRYKSEKVKVKILFFILIKGTWHMFNVSVSINQRGSGSSEERAKLMTSKYLPVIYLIRDGSAYRNKTDFFGKILNGL